METDPAVQAEGMIRLARKNILSSQLLWPVLCVIQLFMQQSQLKSRPAEYLSDPAQLSLLLFWSVLLLNSLVELIHGLFWLRRARAAAQQGQLPPVKGSALTAVFNGISLFTVAAMLVILALASGRAVALAMAVTLVVVFLVACIRNGLREAGFSRGANIIFTATAALVFTITVSVVLAAFVISHQDSGGETFTTSSGYTFSVYHDELPLYVQELEDVPDVSWSAQAEEHRTPLLSRTEYTQRALSNDNSLPDLSYTVTRVKVPALYAPLKTWMSQSK